MHVEPATGGAAPACQPCSIGTYCAGGASTAEACVDGSWDHDQNAASACVPARPCGDDEFELTPPSATQDRVCHALTRCSNTQYEATPPTASSDRVCASLSACALAAVSDACDDHNACTLDTCDLRTGCKHSTLEDGVPCADGDACTSDDKCDDGVCRGGTWYACAMELDLASGRPPFSATASMSDVPEGATIAWLVDGQPAGSGDIVALAVTEVGEHRVTARVTSGDESSDTFPLLLTGSAPVLLVAAEVGAAGATLPLTSDAAHRFDGAQLVIPPGALDGETHIEVREWNDLQLPGLPADGVVLELLPHGATFATPVSLWIPLGTSADELPCEQVAEHVSGYYRGTELEVFEVAEVDCVRRRARIELPHFSDDGVVERAFTATEKVIRGACAYADLLVEPVQYGCEVWGDYADIYDSTKDAIKHAKKAIKLSRTAADLMETYYAGPVYGPEEIDYVLAETVEPKNPSFATNLDAALADADYKVQLNELLNRAPVDRVGDLQLALESLRWYRAEDRRSESVAKAVNWLIEKGMAAPRLAVIAPMITAQVQTAFNVVRAWDDRAVRAQYDHYVQGREGGYILWNEGTSYPSVVDDSQIFDIGDGLGHVGVLDGWFVNLGSGNYPSSFKREPYHWRAFELLYQMQTTPHEELVAARERVLTEIARRVEADRRATASGWVWHVTNNQSGEIVTGSGRDVSLAVAMFVGQKLDLDLSQSEGAPSELQVVQRTGPPSFGTVLHSGHYVGRQDAISFRPPAQGRYRLDVFVIIDATSYRLRVMVEASAPTTPDVSLVAPDPEHPQWANTPFRVLLEARDPSGTDAFFDQVLVRDASGASIQSWMHSQAGNPGSTAMELTLEAGDYTLEAAARARSGGQATVSFALNVQPCVSSSGCACTDECGMADGVRCSTGQWRECVRGVLGCFAWSEPAACPSGFCALNGDSCGACQNQCSQAGGPGCEAGTARTCTADAFGCLAWSNVAECPLGYCASTTTCGSCGDGTCSGSEDCSTCAADCVAGCGDGCCLGQESSASCPSDCGCRPTSCEEIGYSCGEHDDGCGGSLTCGPACETSTAAALSNGPSSMHSCAVSSMGTVACWGSGSDGQLGDGSTASSGAPVSVQGLGDAVAVTTGRYHTCAVRSSGTVLCWGKSDKGQLGNSSVTTSAVPVQVVGISDAISVTAGFFHTCALRSTGEVACWGAGNYGQLGNSATLTSTVPVAVTDLTNVSKLRAGGDHTCALRQDGVVWCWGGGGWGQLGNGATTDRSSPVRTNIDNGVALAGGVVHTCVVRSTGSVSCWGDNLEGQLTATTNGENSPYPAEGLSDATSIAAGAYHTCARRSNGSVACWGRGSEGQLGNDSLARKNALPATILDLHDVVEVTAGYNHSCALRSSGAAVCWGQGSEGQLGNGIATENTSTPVLVAGHLDASAVSAGTEPRGFASAGYYSCALQTTGKVACWGVNGFGTDKATAVEIGGLNDAVMVSTGGRHVCALRSTGAVVCWGSNVYGQLGNNGTASSVTPVSVSGLSDATQISAGGSQTCARRASGEVVCWGFVNTTVAKTPVAIGGITDAASVASGVSHACALRSGGSVVCWGRGSEGQLGNGATADASTPVTVSGLSDAQGLSAGGAHTCALRAPGTVVCWGQGKDGQLGVGAINRSLPQSVASISDAVSVSAGGYHTCAQRATGAVRCWGRGSDGQLGNGSTVGGATSVTVSADDDISTVSAGAYHTCAVRTDGEVLCWGKGSSGQLGDGRPWWPTPQAVLWPMP